MLSKEDVISKLRQFLDDWRVTAKLDGVPVETVQVNLISVIDDLCTLLELDSHEVIGEEVGILE